MNGVNVGEREDDGFVDRLRELVGVVGSANALAKRSGISQSGFQGYLSGAQPTRKMLIALAEAARVDLLWLMTGQGQMRPGGELAAVAEGGTGSLTRLPLYKRPPAGGRKAAEEALPIKPENVAGLGFCRFWLSKHGMEASQLAGLYMNGNSMEPTIANGDTVLANITRRDIVDGDIYVLRIDESIVIKRVQDRHDGHLRLISDNALYPPTEVERSSVETIGRVVWRGSLL